MPDWAQTRVILKHRKPEMMKLLEDAAGSNRFFETTSPLKEGEDFSVYQTKWEPTIDECAEDFKTGGMRFDLLTAWYAPVGWLERMCEQGYKVDAWFADANQKLVHWKNGEEVRSWDRTERKGVPKVIQAVFDWFYESPET